MTTAIPTSETNPVSETRPAAQVDSPTFASLIPGFIDYIRYELALSPETSAKYEFSLSWIIRYLPEISSPADLRLDSIFTLKKRMTVRGLGPSAMNSILFALRKFLSYCCDIRQVHVLDPKLVRPMSVPYKEVIFLTDEEITQLLESISTSGIRGARMRALMELLLASGMRISEALSLDRYTIDWEAKDARIVGKGHKERIIYLTDRAIGWLRHYLSLRKDSHPALFVTLGSSKRWTRGDLGTQFRLYARKAGLKKRVTPHIIRHTMATLLLRNGCDIRYIQEYLGHCDIQTTVKHYLGTDNRSLKAAHEKFLSFGGKAK